MKKFLTVICGLVLFGTLATQAAPITYTIGGIASGSLNSVAFSSKAFTISVVADTTAVYLSSATISRVPDTQSTFSISSVGAGTFSDANLGFFVNRTNGAAGFQSAFSSDYLDVSNAIFSTYDLQTAVSTTAVTFLYSSMNQPTSAGTLVMTSGTYSSMTFTAALVPEPASSTLLIFAGASRALRRQRHRQGAAVIR
jgi:hypothetical protein